MLAIRILFVLLLSTAGWAQEPTPAPQSTPRGTVLGFLAAAHRRDYAAAAKYLNTSLEGPAAEELASQLIAVLDRRLPAHLDQVSNQADGSLNDNLPVGEDLVGSVQTANGPLEILVERIQRRDAFVWLFAAETLKQIPAVYGELNSADRVGVELPEWLQRPAWLSIPLWQWIAIIVGLALGAGISSILRRIAMPMLRRLFGRFLAEQDNRLLDLLAAPIRVLTLIAVLHATVVFLRLPLIARQMWSDTSLALLIVACTWLFLRAMKIVAKVAGRRLQQMGKGDSTSFVRLTQRTLNFVAAFAAIVIVARSAGFNVTAVLAGLGVGGIAVALAAQKTLENLFGGVSLIFDRPIRVGDLCRIGDQEGRVQDIGIRSTRFRTAARTVLTVPNGQLSAMNLENLGMRDKILFRHTIGLRSDTTSQQLNSVLHGVRTLIALHTHTEPPTARVNLVKLGPASMDLEIFTYVLTNENERFLEIQGELLAGILGIVEKSGTATSLPSQVVYLSRDSAAVRPRLDRAPER